ncbi:DUF6524 family protein [Pelagimonas varians]|uniref:Uncharacterized protein n=1 Tax=Pelagimonas varians TaxID=696760 RepID=A0A238KWF7_9RHOB|nr:DUF6524 family protein [Pelagimonas varians]PYG28049.1 hypothetical protein C8N36_11381 [Pelagimonas varians]SMX46921.1 hypothetical protein PEV8663_03421 [Pelagimonas varians]
MSFALRWLFAFVLLAATYNPTQISFVHWATTSWNTDLPLIALSGLLLVIGYVIYIRATLRSIGGLGMALVFALVAAILWVLWDFGLLDLTKPKLATWVGILALSIVLGVGLSWSIIRRKLSGQIDADDIDE